MNLTCDIAMDLIPLYRDGVASADTTAALKQHMKGCKSCSAYCRRYRPNGGRSQSPQLPAQILEQVDAGYEFLAQKIKRRQTISIVTVAAIVSVAVTAAAVSTVRLLAIED